MITILCCLWVLSVFCALLYLPTWEWQEGRLCQEQNIVPAWHLLAVQVRQRRAAVLSRLSVTANQWARRCDANAGVRG